LLSLETQTRFQFTETRITTSTPPKSCVDPVWSFVQLSLGWIFQIHANTDIFYSESESFLSSPISRLLQQRDEWRKRRELSLAKYASFAFP
jgi:hypothetical protein